MVFRFNRRQQRFGLQRMEAGLQHILLMSKRSIAASILIAASHLASAGLLDEEAETVIEPDVTANEVTVADLDTEFFELGMYAGIISIADFTTEPIVGFSANFHATEDFFVQANYAFAKAGKSLYEDIAGNASFYTDSERKYTAYNFLAGWNALPGETFVTSDLTFNSTFYLVAGVGNTDFIGEKHFTFVWGTGYRIIFMESLSAHVDFKDHVFDTTLEGAKRTQHNLELSAGLNYFF